MQQLRKSFHHTHANIVEFMTQAPLLCAMDARNGKQSSAEKRKMFNY